MMRRKWSVLLIMVSCTMLMFLASSCATCSKASLILSKATSVAFRSFMRVFFLYFPSLHLPGRRSLSSSFFPCKPCHGSISLAPSILWLAIPAATDLVFCLLFFFSLLSKEEVFPNPTYTWFSSHHSPNPSTVRFFPTTCLHCTLVSVFLLMPSENC